MQDQPSPTDMPLPAISGHSGFQHDFVNAMGQGRMHHAWLLTGPLGIGKAQLALRAAAWLLAENQSEPLPAETTKGFEIDPADPGVTLVLNGAHPDLKIVAPLEEDNKSGQIKIDQIRALLPFMMHKPGRGGWRVAIIDSMDSVNRNGSNALLKLLEEPPQKTVMFLIASRPGQLPPTIRSRCRVARMTALDQDSSAAVIADIWPDADLSQRELLTILGEGAPGRAMTLAESGAADCYQAVCALLAEDRLDRAALATICGKWGKGGAAGKSSREGAIMLLERLLRLAALAASGVNLSPCCQFEQRVIAALCQRHSAGRLAEMQSEFSQKAAQADALYLDFAQFLSRQLVTFHRKSLP